MRMLEVFKGVLLSIVAFAACGSPLWVFLGVRSMADPEGFWQELAMGVVGYLVLGTFQLIGLAVLILIMILVWSWVMSNIDDLKRRRSQG